MMTRQLETRVRHLHHVSIVELYGEINTFAEEALDAAYGQVCSVQPGLILLDFRQVEYINSTGIALIVSLLAKARAAGCRVVACSLSEHYREIFEITRLDDFMTLYPDQTTALKSSAGIPAAR